LREKKQHLSHGDFLRIRAQARDIPHTDLVKKIDKTVSVIRKSSHGRNSAFAWSGGKDSQALRFLAERAGLSECVLGICDLEYPAFLRWVTDNMPERLNVINTGINLDWLCRNEDMLFPRNSQIAAKWFNLIQHRAQNEYCAKNGIEVLILGRRIQDGNFVGRNGSNEYEKNGVKILSPIADWSHGDVFALIDRFDIPLPPFYGWPRGFRCGTHCWAARQWCGSVRHGWAEVNAIDPQIPVWASNRLKSARDFLRTL